MGACVKLGNRRSACLYIDKGVLEAARGMGLNLSRVSENALVEAIRRLKGTETGSVYSSIGLFMKGFYEMLQVYYSFNTI